MTTHSSKPEVSHAALDTAATPPVAGRLRIPTGSLWLTGVLLLVTAVAGQA